MREMYIAANLKRLRNAYDLNQEEVAGQIGISRQAYSNYERGTRVPDLEVAAKLAEFFHVTIECLVWAEDPVRYWENMDHYTFGARTDVGQVFPLDSPGSKMVKRYLECSGEGKREIEFFVEVKREYEKMKKEIM